VGHVATELTVRAGGRIPAITRDLLPDEAAANVRHGRQERTSLPQAVRSV